MGSKRGSVTSTREQPRARRDEEQLELFPSRDEVVSVAAKLVETNRRSAASDTRSRRVRNGVLVQLFLN
jgi:hypothetical protein